MALAKNVRQLARSLTVPVQKGTVTRNKTSLSGSISIQPVTESHYGDVLDHVTPIFLREEPLSQCFPPCTTGKRESAFRSYAEKQLRGGLSVIALDGNKIVGACLNRHLTKKELLEYSLPSPNDTAEDPLISNIERMLVTLHLKLDIFNKLGVEKLLEIALMSVEPTHIGRGLGIQMLRASLELGAGQGFLAAKADCTGPASTRVCERVGMTSVHKLLYDEYQVDDRVVFRCTPTRGSALNVMVAKLQDSPPFLSPATLKSRM